MNQENKIVGIGYNGMPNGCDDDLLPWSRSAENCLDTKYPYGESCFKSLEDLYNKITGFAVLPIGLQRVMKY